MSFIKLMVARRCPSFSQLTNGQCCQGIARENVCDEYVGDCIGRCPVLGDEDDERYDDYNNMLMTTSMMMMMMLMLRKHNITWGGGVHGCKRIISSQASNHYTAESLQSSEMR